MGQGPPWAPGQAIACCGQCTQSPSGVCTGSVSIRSSRSTGPQPGGGQDLPSARQVRHTASSVPGRAKKRSSHVRQMWSPSPPSASFARPTGGEACRACCRYWSAGLGTRRRALASSRSPGRQDEPSCRSLSTAAGGSQVASRTLQAFGAADSLPTMRRKGSSAQGVRGAPEEGARLLAACAASGEAGLSTSGIVAGSSR